MDKLTNKYSILSSAVVGIEFELYSFKTPTEIAREIGRLLNKKIVVSRATGNIKDAKTDKGFDSDIEASKHMTKGQQSKMSMGEPVANVFTPEIIDKSKKQKDSIEPTANMFVLKRDFSGGRDMNELVTGPLPYEEGRLAIIKILDWIRNNGWTDKRCAIHLNVSFNPYLSKLKTGVSHLEPLKLILSYDEKYVYERFPERRNNVYAKSIYQIIPINKFVYQSTADSLDPTNFVVPDEKYYGLNFTKRKQNYLEIRYLGGKDYEKKTSKILEVLDYSILKIYDALLNPQITMIEADRIRLMMTNMRKVTESFSSPQRFFIDYPNLAVLVDMKGDIEIIKSYWTTLREQLFSLIMAAGVKEGVFNYDTDLSISQFRYGKLMHAHDIKNFEIFDCEFSGSAFDVKFFRCKIEGSRLESCSLLDSNEIEGSSLDNTSSLGTNTLTNCYINSPNDIIDGHIVGGVIRNAILGMRAQVSEETLLVKNTGTKIKV